ncbi:Hexose transporter [Pleurostoma richardsiae]|uniref:Hexose transporter n=1 Tax=Pleurostoma richardsiae TaxID=41990 RepID=A0AA38VGS1_9PEZI|nr:Hexose transporter [Pleurostoma richardsiae]
MAKKRSWMRADSRFNLMLLLSCSGLLSTSLGYDSSMMSSLNILPSYTDYFELTTSTLALQSAISWAGECVAGLFYGKLTEWVGRKKAMWFSAYITLVGVVIQAAAQNIAMFVVGRFVVGLGNGATFICGPIYLAEMFPTKWRGVGLAIFMDFFYVGGLLSSGITYGTAKILSTWAWRLPSILQGLFMISAVIMLPFLPESPRWLVHRGRHEEAIEAIAVTHADGNQEDPVTTGYLELVKSKKSMRRVALALSVAVIAMASGNNIITFYLGAMLDNAGITDSTTQLEINIILNAWCLVIAMIGTFMLDNVGRRPLAIWSSVAMTAFLFLVGGLTKAYGNAENSSGVYGTVAAIFLFQGAYSLGWTPLCMLYPPEVLNYSIRSTGMGLYTFLTNGVGLLVAMAFPFALDAISWKTYMINGAWDVLQVIYVVLYWVETKGKTLEEIDEIFDGPSGAEVLHVQDVIEGQRAGLPAEELEKAVKGMETKSVIANEPAV